MNSGSFPAKRIMEFILALLSLTPHPSPPPYTAVDTEEEEEEGEEAVAYNKATIPGEHRKYKYMYTVTLHLKGHVTQILRLSAYDVHV